MSAFKITDNVYPLADEVQLGDTIQLTQGDALPVVACQKTGVKMLNIDADQIQPGDLKFIKAVGLTISNPDTDLPVALGVDYLEGSWGHRINDYLTDDSIEDEDDEDDDDDDDSSFFGAGLGFLGGLGSSAFSGGSSFGGFGGGSFSGGGASSSF